MLRLLDPTPTFKGDNSKEFLKKNDNELDIFLEFLENPMIGLGDMTRL
jgi:hypothetical protein